ncbi:hypothetical protein FBT96_20325 [Rhodobacter capsulatus]|uniref:EAL domain-containing protein n=1 Tax=Rhodobacter capsulatus TaxID=1061 RepID=A0A4U1JIQ1_RHOCA|nr:hypothetical protein [Rhodobacter capsulatus]TKD12534.1 hypothetical protein FBT96_20325 [Rhodobacter capsulatus]
MLAEGIETEAQNDWLHRHGHAPGKGHRFGKLREGCALDSRDASEHVLRAADGSPTASLRFPDSRRVEIAPAWPGRGNAVKRKEGA